MVTKKKKGCDAQVSYFYGDVLCSEQSNGTMSRSGEEIQHLQ